MSEWIKNLFVAIFGEHSGIATFIISMIPIVELRGAIPFGSATGFWGENALELWQSLLVSLAGSSLVCIILTFMFWPIFKWLKQTKIFRKIALWVEKKLNRNAENINNKVKTEKDAKKIKWLKLIGIFGFVAIPIPLTGVWTGTCLALFIGLNKKETMTTVALGNIVAGLLMTLISYFFADNTMIVFYAFFVLIGIFVLYGVIRSIIKKVKNKKQKTEQSEEIVEALETETTEKDIESQNSEEAVVEEKDEDSSSIEETAAETKEEGK